MYSLTDSRDMLQLCLSVCLAYIGLLFNIFAMEIQEWFITSNNSNSLLQFPQENNISRTSGKCIL